MGLFPNPTYGKFTIDLGKVYDYTTITITDLTGKIINSNKFYESQYLQGTVDAKVGIYLLIIESGDKKAVLPLIKN